MQQLFKSLCITFSLCALLNFACASTITVNPLFASLTFKNRYHDIQVQNAESGKGDTAYVAISIYKVNHPGMPDQSFTKLDDNPYKIGLIVTPNKMVIPAGQMRIARVLYIGKPVDADVLYEVKFTPVSGNLIAIGQDKKNIAAGVELVIAYGVGILVRPVDLKPNVTAVRHGKNVTLSNTGNTTVSIGNCNLDKDFFVRLYPGNVKHATLKEDASQICKQEILENQVSNFEIK